LKAINYTGPSLDYSGYGEANRHDIGALLAAGADVSTTIPSYCEEKAEYGELGQIVSDLEGKVNGYQIKIIHTTPDVIEKYREDGKYTIGRIFWETDKLPELFAVGARLCDEIWTGSEFNKRAIHAAGVDVPIYVIPEAIDAKIERPEPFKMEVPGFRFYSIFEWTERKNPRKLLEAYWREFEHEDPDKVAFLLKTYISHFNWKKKEEIIGNIEVMKHRLGLSSYAPIYMYGDLMNRNQIYRFHMAGDCFVSAHRGEGWGIPQMEALLMGKPAITTGLGGIHEYLVHQKDAYLLKYELIPVRTDRNPQWYCEDQHWAEIDVDELRAAMRWAYDNQKDAKAMGERGTETIKAKFDLPFVGKLMKARLEQI
jgi:glycosyltransferase involved in cell wall biosynthesis